MPSFGMLSIGLDGKWCMIQPPPGSYSQYLLPAVLLQNFEQWIPDAGLSWALLRTANPSQRAKLSNSTLVISIQRPASFDF